MSDGRKLMCKAIKRLLVPILREKKFKGTFPHFFRERAGHIDLLTFQFNKYGGSFIVEISYADKQRKNIYDDKTLLAKKLRVSQATDRLRLGSIPKKRNTDHWFRYDQKKSASHGDIYQSAAKKVMPYLERQAEEWWHSKDLKK